MQGVWARALEGQPSLQLPWVCVQGPPSPTEPGVPRLFMAQALLWEMNGAGGSEHGRPGMRQNVLGTSGRRRGSAPRLLTTRPQAPIC